MGAAYTIFGRQVPSHQLAIATLSLVALLVVPNPFATKPAHPPIKASSPEEEKFVKEWLAKHDKTEEKH
ncbi:ATP19 [Candida pseudojiufengensis]|uniref:ATP19 n=1 Tax=Candida pseudojiufengensis TaxID=497109 RepID=UPI0022241B89|nr:ATP19 [Candida pseudojiufengensis]KAI5961393.1 ATP19 [Candida pseudojiufengensis]